MELLIGKLIPILGVVGTILVLVIAHELGHFLAAKMCRMRVEEFAVGFGSRKWTILKRNGTEYNIRPIPAGGFVRIAGMDPGEENPEPDSFMSKSIPARMWVIIAGPLASFLLAYVLFCSLGLFAKFPVVEPVIEKVAPKSPAAAAGFQKGDRFLVVAGTAITDSEQLRRVISSHPGKSVEITIQRGSEKLIKKPTIGKDGKLGFIMSHSLKKLGLWESIVKGNQISFEMVTRLVSTIFSKRITQDAGGPIAIIQATHGAAQSGFDNLVIMTAGLSLNFAVLNLLPIPAVLDGGHLAMLVAEAIRRKRLSVRTWAIAQAVGLAMIAVIIVLVMYKDISTLFMGTAK